MAYTGSYIGKTIDRYEFQELIGTGAFGEVYQVFDNRLLRNVAIKVTSPVLSQQRGSKEEIIREARIHARAEHANIVPVYDVFDDEQSVFIVMRLVTGEDLDHMLSRLGHPLDINEALNIMHQILWGMDYAHSKGIVHLDLKPGNIRLTHCGEALIMDFGAASLLEEQCLENDNIHGTPSYMPPEQITGSYMDARSDIYSLGIIFYKMITGHHPFKKANTLAELLKCHEEEAPVAPSHYIETLPKKFEQAILKALEKKSYNRYHSCREFAFALGHSLKGYSQYDSDNKELRWDPRVAVYMKVRIQLNESDEYISAETINLSASGANLLISSDIPVGSKIGLEFYLPNNEIYTKVEAKATVLWKDNKPEKEIIEIGVSLDEIGNMHRQYIAVLVRNLLLNVEQDELPSERTMTF
jgi:serine/threonine protein kinase